MIRGMKKEKRENMQSINEIKEILDGIPLSHPKVMLLVKEMIRENIRP